MFDESKRLFFFITLLLNGSIGMNGVDRNIMITVDFVSGKFLFELSAEIPWLEPIGPVFMCAD